jgi:hypothetical protein
MTEVTAAALIRLARPALDVAIPMQLRFVGWQTARQHDPANRQAAPDHLIIVGTADAADHGQA